MKHIIGNYSNLLGQLNKETLAHSKNVARISYECSQALGLNPVESYKIGLLHDVGKIYIPSRILKKNNRLTGIEREIIDLHSYLSYRLIKDLGESPDIYIPVLYHHGFDKPKIKFLKPAIIVTHKMREHTYLVHSVDVFDALIQKRIYHDPFDQEEIFKILKEDPMCTDDILEEIKKFSCTEIRGKNNSYIFNNKGEDTCKKHY